MSTCNHMSTCNAYAQSGIFYAYMVYLCLSIANNLLKQLNVELFGIEATLTPSAYLILSHTGILLSPRVMVLLLEPCTKL